MRVPDDHEDRERPGSGRAGGSDDPTPPGEPGGSDDPTPPGEPGGAPRESTYDLLQRGHALLAGRHHAQAAVVLERAAKQEPGRGSILEALGRAYYNSGQHERARATFEALLEVDPSAHYGHYALGQSLKQLGRTDEARTHLRLAVALSPANALYRGALRRLPPAADRR
jgi:tetratricopeptide (TPR) repeat protein